MWPIKYGFYVLDIILNIKLKFRIITMFVLVHLQAVYTNKVRRSLQFSWKSVELKQKIK